MSNNRFIFRAWNVDEKRMMAPIQINIGQNYKHEVSKPDFIYMQNTGLRDRFGKEIYEGDIVKQKEDKRTGIVTWNEFEGKWIIQEESYSWSLGLQADTWIVTGNIYQNKEELQ